ncbi:MAG: hypothetical protein RL473_554 [Actinomycetota bacterium]
MLLKPSTMGGRLFDGGMFRDCSDERDHFQADMNWLSCYPEKTIGLPDRNCVVIEPRQVMLESDAVLALTQILGIMLDQLFEGENTNGWNSESIIDLEARLMAPGEQDGVLLGIDDVALLLHGMAYTEVMSEDLPWIDSVRSVADFITVELRQHWTEDEWRKFS